MTTTATQAPARHSDPLAHVKVSFAGIMRSEWIKLMSLRSTPWSIASTIIVMALLSWGAAWGFNESLQLVESGEITAEESALPPGIAAISATAGYIFGQIVVVVMGTLTISGEYSTGQIKSSIAAVPHRTPLLATKGIIVASVAFVTGTISVAIGALIATAYLRDTPAALDLSDGETVRILLGGPLYLAAVALLALGIGSLLRHAAGAIAASLGLLVVLPIATTLIRSDWFQDIAPYFPSNAGGRIMGPNLETETLTPWAGFGVMGIYIAVIWVAAIVLLRRRDA